VLLRLVEYLGHTNPVICGLAYNEVCEEKIEGVTFTNKAQIRSLAQSADVTPMRLFRPFWRSIAITVVKELQNRPQVAQQLSDLLGITVSEFLIWTKTNTLPYLILMRRHDVLRRIAQAHGSDTSVWSICVEPVNMAAILAFLLIQPSPDPEKLITTLLTETSTDFKERDLADLVKMEPILTTFELLKAAGEVDETRNPKVGVAVRINASEMLMAAKIRQAIILLATNAFRKGGSTKGSTRKNLVGPFFETYVLGIMDQVTSVINDVRVIQPVAEKKRCLGAIREMVKLAKSYIASALPQVTQE